MSSLNVVVSDKTTKDQI